MMTRTLSLVDAVDGGTPMSSRKLFAMVAGGSCHCDCEPLGQHFECDLNVALWRVAEGRTTLINASGVVILLVNDDFLTNSLLPYHSLSLKYASQV